MRKLLIKCFIFTGLCGCGIESTIPSDASTAPPSEAERAVTISNTQQTATGTIITCELNDSLVSDGLSIPIFLEFEGTEIQRTTLTNQPTFTFNEYNPPADGNVLCVVEFASAEFESESMLLEKVP